MNQVTLKGNPVNLSGSLPQVGEQLPSVDNLVKADLSSVSLSSCHGSPLVLNIFPSIDTGTCAQSVRTFNQHAAASGARILCLSQDLPFALSRFCGAEGIDKVEALSAFRSNLGAALGLSMADGPLQGLLARAVLALAASGELLHLELVPEIAQEPNYQAALAALA